MTQVVMTGMGGFIGRHAAVAMQNRGVEVADLRGEDRYDFLQAGERARAIDQVQADVLVHLAWVTEHGHFWNSDLNNAWETATIDLATRFLAKGGQRIIGIGSGAEYDWAQGQETFAENSPLAPHTLYGAAKARTGEKLLRLAEEYTASAAWGRVFFTFGKGEPVARLIPSMLIACLKEEAIACGPHDTVRDFWDVRNLGEAIASLALSDVAGPINIASGKGTSFENLGRLIRKTTGASDVIRYGKRSLGEGEPATIVADTARLQRELGFVERISLETGLSNYCETLRRVLLTSTV